MISPSGQLNSGEVITVSVGANSLFTPHAHINVLECADPGGSAASLPKDITTCDGNTIQGDSVLVGANGSFSVTGYTVYQLARAWRSASALGMASPWCNQTSSLCALCGAGPE